jgi:hypothetical protein
MPLSHSRASDRSDGGVFLEFRLLSGSITFRSEHMHGCTSLGPLNPLPNATSHCVEDTMSVNSVLLVEQLKPTSSTLKRRTLSVTEESANMTVS